MKERINANILKKMLNRVYLGGIIEQCVLDVDSKGVGVIQSVDMTNCLFLRCEENISIGNKTKLGLGNLKLLCGFLDSCTEEEINIVVEKNRVVFSRKGHGKLSYLLSEAEVIPTIVEEPDAIKSFIDGIEIEVPIKESFKDDLLSYLSLTGLGSIRFSIGEKEPGKIVVLGGLDSDHKFRLFLTKLKNFKNEPYELELNAKILIAILNVLEWEGLDQPVFGFGPDQPLTITNGANNFWTLVGIEQ